VQSHQVAILIRRAVASGPEAIRLVPFQPHNGGYRHLVADVYLHAVTGGIADKRLGLSLPATRGFPMERSCSARWLPFGTTSFPKHPSDANEIPAGFLTAIANNPFTPRVGFCRDPDGLADTQQFNQTDPES